MKNYLYTNWAKNTRYNKKILYPKNLNELKKICFNNLENFGVCGNLRSFSDTCINKKKLISLKKFPKLFNLDKKKGIVSVSSNTLLIEILEKIIPEGFSLSVMPGSKYVTVGGIISNNVIGKNSEKNQLKYYIKEIKLLTSKNEIIKCSKSLNNNLFDLTVGGFGLTGTIISAKLILKRIKNQLVNIKTEKFKNLNDFKKIASKKKRFSVAWINSHSLNNNSFDGLFYSGDYNNSVKNISPFIYKNKKMNFLEKIFLISYIKSFMFSKMINFFYLNFFIGSKKVSFDKFFFPQDKWLDFNDCYKNGFFQVQFLIPEKKFRQVISKISLFLKTNSIKSTFVILKKVNEVGKYLNFFGKGYSLSFDFEKNKNYNKIKVFFNKLIYDHNLKLNFSKDSISSHEIFKDDTEFKKFIKNIKLIDKKKIYNNEFSKRLKIK